MQSQVPYSIVGKIPACHAGVPGSIPGEGAFFFFVFVCLFIMEVLNRDCNKKALGEILFLSTNLFSYQIRYLILKLYTTPLFSKKKQ